MRKYLYFLSADAAHLQTRLNRLAQRGLELVSTDGLFTGAFHPTSRTDLAYLVVPCGRAEHFPGVEVSPRFGWTLVGGFNGMAIFASLPCGDTDEEGLLAELGQAGAIHRDRLMPPGLVLLCLAFVVVLAALERWYPGLSGQWYLSHLGVGVPVVGGILLALAAANVVLLRSYAAAWVHGLTPPALLGGVLALLLCSLLDETSQTAFFAVISLALGLAFVISLWRRCKPLGFALCGICLAVLCVGLLFPSIDRTEMSGKGLHNELADAPVVQLSDLGDDSQLKGTGYSTDGTWLVGKSTYWELSEAGSLSGEVYRCLTSGLAQQVVDGLLSVGKWEETEAGWRSEDGKTVLLREKNTVCEVSCGSALKSEQISVIQDVLLGQ